MGNFAIVTASDPSILDTISLPLTKEHVAFVPKVDVDGNNKVLLSDSKQTIVNAVDWSEFILKVKQLSGALGFELDGKLVQTPSRYTYSTTIQYSAAFIHQFFQGLGYQAFFQNFTIGGNKAQNVYGIKMGVTYPNEIVVIGAHYDSTSEKATTLAPGANDDGSGSAGVMHLAELFSTINTDRTIHFVVFSGEEQGLYGSAYYVSQVKNNQWNIKNAICMDMISYSSKYLGVTVEGTNKFVELIDVLELNMLENANNKLFQTRTSLTSFGSDHVSFQKAGIPAILLIEMDDTNTPYYHNTKDTWNTLDQVQTVAILRGAAGCLCDLAGCK